MVLIPIALASMTLTVWINEVPDWQKGGALAQLQFEDWYLQPLYPDDEIGLPPELVRSRRQGRSRSRRSFWARSPTIFGRSDRSGAVARRRPRLFGSRSSHRPHATPL